MIGFHSGMPGARNDSGPFSQSANDAMAGPWLNSSSFQVGRSAFLGSVCAGGAVRAICQLVGIKNIYSKVYGRRTPINVVRATIDAISQLKTQEQINEVRYGIAPKKSNKSENKADKEEK